MQSFNQLSRFERLSEKKSLIKSFSFTIYLIQIMHLIKNTLKWQRISWRFNDERLVAGRDYKNSSFSLFDRPSITTFLRVEIALISPWLHHSADCCKSFTFPFSVPYFSFKASKQKQATFFFFFVWFRKLNLLFFLFSPV